MAYIYTHIRLDKNEVFYVGIGSDTEYRRAYSSYERNRYWNFITNKTDYEVKIIEDDLSWDTACDREKYWISYYGRKDLKEGNLCNLTDGGEGSIGYVKPLKVREQHSKTISGKNNPMYGKSHTDKTRELISKNRSGINYGIPRPDEVKNKISNTLKGREFTDEHKEKLSQANKNRKVLTCPHCGKSSTHNMKRYHFDNCKTINDNVANERYKTGRWKGYLKVIDNDENEKIYNSATEAAREMKTDVHNILEHAENSTTYSRGMYKGYKFEFIEEKNE